MRKLLLTIIFFGVLFLSPNFVEAQRGKQYVNSSELKIKMYDNSKFVIVFDGKKYKIPKSHFKISDIKPDDYRIIIKRKYGRLGSENIIYKGNIEIPEKSIVKAKINRYNRLIIKKIIPK